MRGLQIILTLIGRLCLGTIFILSAVHKIINWQGTERGVIHMLCDWHAYVSHSDSLQAFFTGVLPWVTALLVASTVIELLGGILVFFGVKARFGAFLLLIFLIPTTILFHAFWFLDGARRDMQLVMFLKNLAIFGGLLYVLAYGARIRKKNYPSVDNPDLES